MDETHFFQFQKIVAAIFMKLHYKLNESTPFA
jgi:hypothetical protein